MSREKVAFKTSVETLLHRIDALLPIVGQRMDERDRFHELEGKSNRLQSRIEALLGLAHQDETSRAECSHRWQQLQRRKRIIDAKLAELYVPFRDTENEIRNFIGEVRDVLDCVPVDPPALREIRMEIKGLPLWMIAHAPGPIPMPCSYSDLPKMKKRLLEMLASLSGKIDQQRDLKVDPWECLNEDRLHLIAACDEYERAMNAAAVPDVMRARLAETETKRLWWRIVDTLGELVAGGGHAEIESVRDQVVSSPQHPLLERARNVIRLIGVISASHSAKAGAARATSLPVEGDSQPPTELERREFGRLLQRTMDDRRDSRKSAAAKIGKGISAKTLANLLDGKPVKKFSWEAAHRYVEEPPSGR